MALVGAIPDAHEATEPRVAIVEVTYRLSLVAPASTASRRVLTVHRSISIACGRILYLAARVRRKVRGDP